jgi:DNA-binding response OmpR family regulator
VPVERIANGRPVLLVEDEMALVVMIEDALLRLGVRVVGPVARLDAALRLAREAPIDAAVLDINIRGGNSYPVADILTERSIPFVFCTGYGDWALEERYRDRPRLTKPFNSRDLECRVLEMLGVRAT